MAAFVHSIPAPILRYLPIGLGLILVVYILCARRFGWRRRQASPTFNPIALVLCAILLIVDLVTTFVHR